MCVAENIRRIIKQKGLMQKTVAERAGFTAHQFTDMLRGRKILRVEYVPAIAEALGVPIALLFSEK